MLQFSKLFTGKPTFLSDLRSYHETFLVRCIHHKASRRNNAVEPKSDKERLRLGLPLREPWFEIKPLYEKRKYFALRLKEILKAQPYHKIEVAKLGTLRAELDAIRNGKQRKIATYVRKYPLAFSLKSRYTNDNRKKTWCSFTDEAKELLEEEKQIIQKSEGLLVQKVCKILMISVKNRLPLASIDLVRESLGLPFDYREGLVKKYPGLFYVNERKGRLYLELSDWDESLAQSALERNAILGENSSKLKEKKKKGKLLIDAGQVKDEEQKEPCEDIGCLSLDEYSDSDKFASNEFQKETSFNSVSNEFQREPSTKSVSNEFKQQPSHLEHEYAAEEASQVVNSLVKPDVMSHHHNYTKMGSNPGTLDMSALGSTDGHTNKTNLKPDSYSINENIQETVDVSYAINPENIKGTLSASCLMDKAHQGELISKSGAKCENMVDVYVHRNSVNSFPSAVHQLLRHTNYNAGVEKPLSVGNHLHHANTEAGSAGNKGNEDATSANAVTTLCFPWKNKKGLQPKQKRAIEIEEFQSEPYISPYKNSRDLELPLTSVAAEKFAVAVIHEFLSLTLEKRATIQQLEQLRKPYRLPEDLIEFLLRYDGIFYVVRGTPRSHVFLKEAYKEGSLIEKEPLLLWQERFVELALKCETSDAPQSKRVTEPREPILKGYYAYKDPKGYFGSEGCKIKV